MSELIEVYDIAEEASKKALVRIYKTEQEGMAHLGKRQFRKMILAVEAALEQYTTVEDKDH
jgi:hypothetical protein